MISLYIHIPWCLHKCSYCDFYSLPSAAGDVPGAGYVDRLIGELRSAVIPAESPICGGDPEVKRKSWAPAFEVNDLAGVTKLHSIFLGGGTPSMIAPRELGRLLDAIARRFDMPAEISIEANPETLNESVLRELRAVGFTRLSCGVQSFDPKQLQFLERVHSADKARDALRSARRAGFENVNLDLIYTLPNQTLSDLEMDLREAIALEPTHISAYQLIVEPGTPLERKVARGDVPLPDEDTAIAMWHRVRDVLGDAGYAAYEVSNYARSGFECAHNIHYWKCGDYLGIGTGAVSRIGTHRWCRAKNTKAYMAGELLIDQEEHLTLDQLRTEVCMLGLRMTTGLDLQKFESRFGKSFEETYPGKIAAWKEKGLAACDSDLRLTPSGMLILDSLVAELV